MLGRSLRVHPSLRFVGTLLAGSVMVGALLSGCSSDPTPTSSTFTTLPRTGAVRIRVLGDTPGAGAAIIAATSSDDATDLSVSASSLGAWMDLPREDGDGAVHDRLVQITWDAPDLVVASLGGDALVIPDDRLMACAKASSTPTDRPQFIACAAPLLDARLVNQRVMAIAFDVLAHTRDAKLVLVGHAGADPTSPLAPWQQAALAELLDARIAAATIAVGESGATWAERVVFCAPTDCVAAVRSRGWI